MESSISAHLEKVALGAFALGATALSLQAASPLEGNPTAPAWLNAIFYCGLVVGLGALVRVGSKDERAAALLGLVASLHLPLSGELWTARGAAEFASLASQLLSTSYAGLPVIGLLHAWAVVLLGFCCARALARTASDPDATIVRISAGFVGTMVVVFGVRALIGYVTGSTSLIV